VESRSCGERIPSGLQSKQLLLARSLDGWINQPRDADAAEAVAQAKERSMAERLGSSAKPFWSPELDDLELDASGLGDPG